MKKYLLDTHTLLWAFEKNPKLSKKAKTIFSQNNSKLFVSIVTFWELTIKVNIGKLDTEITITKLYEEAKKNNIIILALDYKYINLYETLPLHHRDPFDRMLIAQAKVENLTIITKDSQFQKYDIDILW